VSRSIYSNFIYGTTRLGDSSILFDDRVNIARAAMKTGVWFHTSHTYGDALQVLRTAYDQARSEDNTSADDGSVVVPKSIYKIWGTNMGEMREDIRKNLEPLGLDYMDVGQLCLGFDGELADQFRAGGACLDEFRRLKEEGIVRGFVMEVFPWTSDIALGGLRSGRADDIVDAYIFYLNPLQCFASNELWDEIHERNTPILALRTVGGGPVHRLRDVPGAAWKDYLRVRAGEVAPIFERSGIESWTEFCIRFAFSFPLVQATIGATAREANLTEFIKSSQDPITPLPEDIQNDIMALHRRWSDEMDMQVEPWTM
jgi:predicted aldo/keto reductase-like oxidoreductase